MEMKNQIEFTLPLTMSTLVQCHAPFCGSGKCAKCLWVHLEKCI